ncbi:MAG TPA: MerR family transcriptional regulator [Candidatus Megamonas gallistercoris]|nr:MerR family transcriptional regulator [Candidatus Megamonas gallistercoris]
MTKQEASEHFNIPISVLDEYESWGLCGAVKKVMGVWQYDDSDLEYLSMIMTLHDIGFNSSEVEMYMRLLLNDKSTDKKQLEMLNKKRDAILDRIHFREKQLERLDYLRYEINKNMKNGR